MKEVRVQLIRMRIINGGASYYSFEMPGKNYEMVRNIIKLADAKPKSYSKLLKHNSM